MFLTRPASCPVSSSWLPTSCNSCPTLLLANSELFPPLSPRSLCTVDWEPLPSSFKLLLPGAIVTVNRKVDEYGNL